MEKLSDKQLVSRYLKGDEKALAELYDRYERMLYFFILKKVRQPDIAEDLFQEIWMKVLHSMPNVHFMSNLKNWLFRISTNHIIDYFRQQKTRVKPFSLDSTISSAGEKESTFYSILPDPQGEDPRHLIDEEEKDVLFQEAFETLPPQIQEVVLLRMERDLKFKDIAKITGTPLNTVLSRMRQAVIKMNEYIMDKGSELS